jgi:hypothetical protein
LEARVCSRKVDACFWSQFAHQWYTERPEVARNFAFSVWDTKSSHFSVWQSANGRPNVLRASFSAVNGANCGSAIAKGRKIKAARSGSPRRRPKNALRYGTRSNNGPFATQTPITIGPIPDFVQEVVSAEATPLLSSIEIVIPARQLS